MNVMKKIGAAIGTICVPIAFFDTIAYPSCVVGTSMEPTLRGGDGRWWKNDVVWMSRWIGEPKRDHIYSFKYPRDPKRKHIKRLKYKSGDIVRAKSMETITIPQKHFWMVSDNRDTGNDSFVYGPVSRGLIEAEAKYIIWPFERIGKIK